MKKRHDCARGVLCASTIKYLLIMKLLIIFLLAFTFQALAVKSFSQERINLSLKNNSLLQIFKAIENTTSYRFVYGEDIANDPLHINLYVKDATLDYVMQKLSLSGRIIYSKTGTDLISIIKKPVMPYSGTVLGEDGNPLPNVSVTLKRTGQGTSTNEQGKFYLEANEGDSIELSSVGYITLLYKLTSQTAPVIQLQASENSMDEIVVVGLGNTQRKISVVGAISTVTGKELRQSPVANLTNALAGRLPGLFTVQANNVPGANSNFNIRGISTSGSNTSPLIVVDGLVRDVGDFGNIDPNEVENVSILKDATSTALYGIQGANGVVVVTTRRGRIGRKPDIGFTANYAVQSPVRLPQYLDQYQMALYEEESTPGTYTAKEIEDIKTGNFNPSYYAYTNWFDYLLKKSAPQQNYNLNFSGGSEFVRYFVSGSYTKQESLFDHEEKNKYGSTSNFNRFNFRSNIDINVTSMLTLQVDVAGRLETRVGPSIDYTGLFNAMNRTLPSVTNPLNPDGSYQLGSKLFLAADWDNPYAALINSGYYNDFWNNMYGTFSANHKLDFITPGLNVQGLVTFQTNNNKRVGFSQNYDAFRYTVDASGNPVYTRMRTATTLSSSNAVTGARNSYFDLRINYNRKFDKHNVGGQLLGNRRLAYSNSEVIPFAYQGVTSRITYGYDDRYFAEVNMGYNGSENFPKESRYGFFPSFSAGWVISNEKFYKDNGALKYLKLRGSYGIVGNDQIGGARFLYISDYVAGGAGYMGNGFNENRVGNPNVTWEEAKKMNLGIEANFFKGLVEITFDYFKENRDNILLAAGTVPTYVGISNLAPRNTGRVLNRGFEAELKVKKTYTSGFNFFSNFSVTYARNKVLANDQPNPLYPYQNLIGYQIGYQLGYKALGIFKDLDEVNNSPYQDPTTSPGDIKYMDTNKDGVINAFDRVPIQNQNFPRYVFSSYLGAGYKGLDFSVLLNGTTGGTVNMSTTNRDYFLRGRKIWEDRWTPANTDNPRLPRANRQASMNMLLSDFWLQETDYLKIRNAEIGYSLPQNISRKIKINTVRFFVNGQNLAVWDRLWAKEGDPESVGNVIYYPAQRVVNFGVNVKF